jgi:hypothetical protein
MKGILIVDHGSVRAEANDMLRCMSNLLQTMAGPEVIVRYAHMELAEPDIPTGGGRCVARGARRVLMVPYFLSAGVHLTPGIGKEVVAQFVKCGSGACEAVAAFDDAVAAEFTAAPTTEVKFVAGNGKTASLKIPNGGFGAAYPAWLSAMPAPAGAPAPSPTKPASGRATPNGNTRGSESTPAP